MHNSYRLFANPHVAISLSQQSLKIEAPSASAQFSHHVSLLVSRSDTQRKESLSYLVSTTASRPVNAPLQQPVGVLLPKLLPLVLDGSNGVRAQLLKFLQILPAHGVEDHIEDVLLYIRAGMTHLAADIRSSSMDILAWALNTVGQQLVSCAGGWVKTLKCFLAMLGWPNEDATVSWSSQQASFGKGGSEGKVYAKNLNTLATFLRIGLSEGSGGHDDTPASSMFPIYNMQQHMIARKSNAFAHLNLFGLPRDEESGIYDDREDRQRVFCKAFQQAVERGLEVATKGGGEVGRAAASVKRAMTEGLKDYESEI